jgi:tripartite-type tricarboxylate transporter receptor subunit TctC
MKLKNFLRIAVALSVAFAAFAPVAAQPFPNKPIKLVVPYPPGGSADILARTVGQGMAERLGQPVVVESRPGAGTAIGAKAVAVAAADGYTLLIGTVSSHAMNPALNDAVGYDPIKDFTAIGRVASIPFVLLAKPDLAAKSLSELLAMERAKPGAISYASAGAGTSNHLAGELLDSMARVKTLHVPYKGSAPALNDLLGGQVDTMFDLQLTALPHIKSGKARALAITSPRRSSLLPDVATVAEQGVPGYDVSAWFGIYGPAGMPQATVEQLNAALVAVLRNSDVRAKLEALGAEPEPGTAAEFAAFTRTEQVKWANVIKGAGIVVKP